MSGMTDHQEFYILYGNGANGKSVFISTLSKLLGTYSKAADFKTFIARKGDGPRNDLATLKGARLVCASEIGPGEHLDETVMKQVTGEDLITARFLYGEFFEYQATFKVFLASNHLPRVVGTEEGIWRRFRIIPFLASFTDEQRDKRLLQQLEKEQDGILTWALKGWAIASSEGWTTPAEVIDQVKNYRADSDTVQEFLDSQCVVDAREEIGASDLFNAYRSWCEEAAENPVNLTLFGKKLSELRFAKRKGAKMMRSGLRLRMAKDDGRIQEAA